METPAIPPNEELLTTYDAHIKRRLPLHTKILIGLTIGALIGLIANMAGSGRGSDANKNGLADWLDSTVYWVEPVGKVFLRLMFMVVLPLVISALALAVVEIGDLRRLGRMGLRTLLYTAILSGSAVLIGVVLVNVVQPGKGLPPELTDRIIKQEQSKTEGRVKQAQSAKSIRDTLVDLIPENPLQEMVGALDGSSKGNGMLAVMVFSLILGIAITVNPDKCQGLVSWLAGLNSISMTVIEFAMRLAPVGAGCLVFTVTAQLGFPILKTLAWFVGACVFGLALHLFGTYSIVLKVLAKKSPVEFFRQCREAMLVAFGTSSSNATLPTSIKVAMEDLKLPPKVANFVLTVGATGNQNGTALFEGFVVLFLAQVTNVDLSFSQQFTVVLMSVLAGVGTAGVPGGSIPLIIVVMQSVGVPAEAIGIVFGVDRILDMCRTVVNVTGDLVVTQCVASSEPAQ
ncbi:MAG TPA: dicarboxylate/amino acid:cation symporter [Caulifigura sp.]|nr:dicarboxylate/amino acid:cation symporter [Caulifigura sp.]